MGGIERIVGVVPARRGFGWGVVEFGEILLDWGCSRIESQLDEVLTTYRPDWVAIPDAHSNHELFSREVMTHHAALPVEPLRVRQAFLGCGADSDYDRARALANQFPQLRDQLPTPALWPWDREKRAMFYALVVALASRWYAT